MSVATPLPRTIRPRPAPPAAVSQDRFDPYSAYVGGGKPTPTGGLTEIQSQERLHLSPLWNSLLGTVAVAISKTGFGIEYVGKKLGLFSSLGSIQKPLPPSRLTDLPAYKLERPIVLVPGFQTPKNRFEHIVDKLTADGLNGGAAYYVKDGEFYTDIDCTRQTEPSHPPAAPQGDPVGRDAKVFVAVFHSTQDVPTETAPQLDATLKTIRQFTGATKVDAVGYSMGGLATRAYLDHGGEDVGRFSMVGTPNQGSALSQLSMWLLDLKAEGRGVDWLVSRKPLSEADRPALQWLRPVDSPNPNSALLDLNSRVDAQNRQAEQVLSMGSKARYTSDPHVKPVHGDGTVPASSLELPNTEVMTLSGKVFGNHGLLLSNPEVYQGLAGFFHWTPVEAGGKP